jgi:hypothetical protein
MDAKSLGGAVSLEKVFESRKQNVRFTVSRAYLARVDHVDNMANTLLVLS